MRNALAALAFVALVGCGGSFGESFTSKAMSEFRAGNGYDWRAKGKQPGAKDIAAVEKRIKDAPAGSRKDFWQAIRVLSNHRDHDDIAFNTLAKSSFNRAAYIRVFGEPEAVNTKEVPNSWSHTCTDGKVTLKGSLRSKSEPDVILTFPQKPKF